MSRVEELSIDEIRKRYVQNPEAVSQRVLNRLQRDSRQGVQRLWKSGIRDIAGADDSKRLDPGTRAALAELIRAPQHVLVDARTVPGIPMPQNAFNKGDGINFTIAAASIIAKTSRDRMMKALSPCFYTLKTGLFAARTRAALEEFETALRARAAELIEAECRKLRLLVGRRWKAIP